MHEKSYANWVDEICLITKKHRKTNHFSTKLTLIQALQKKRMKNVLTAIIQTKQNKTKTAQQKNSFLKKRCNNLQLWVLCNFKIWYYWDFSLLYEKHYDRNNKALLKKSDSSTKEFEKAKRELKILLYSNWFFQSLLTRILSIVETRAYQSSFLQLEKLAWNQN